MNVVVMIYSYLACLVFKLYLPSLMMFYKFITGVTAKDLKNFFFMLHFESENLYGMLLKGRDQTVQDKDESQSFKFGRKLP